MKIGTLIKFKSYVFLTKEDSIAIVISNGKFCEHYTKSDKCPQCTDMFRTFILTGGAPKYWCVFPDRTEKIK